jgi:predicted DNA-binding transcriptional regulator AlpA
MSKLVEERLWSEKEISFHLGLRPRTLQMWRLLGKGPKYLRLSDRLIRYKLSEVLAWVEERQNQQK